jgi:hypothetical protein
VVTILPHKVRDWLEIADFTDCQLVKQASGYVELIGSPVVRRKEEGLVLSLKRFGYIPRYWKKQ